jgi:WD40 repeat protein
VHNLENAPNITSVRFSLCESLIFTGKDNGSIEIFDIEKVLNIRRFRNHSLRVGRLEI